MLCGGCSDVDTKDAFCVPWMLYINMKGLKHLVVVFLDLNFQTTSD